MEEGDQDKTEKPSTFKLMRARQQGTVSRGTDLGYFTGLTAFLGYTWMNGAHIAQIAAQAVRNTLLEGATLADGQYATLAVTAKLFTAVAGSILLMAGLIFFVVLLFEVVQTGPVFSFEPLKPDFTRLNPASGLKRLFTVRLLVEAMKNILKMCVYGGVAFLVIQGAVNSGASTIADGQGLMIMTAQVSLRLLAYFTAVAFLFAILDQAIARRDFLKRMGMSKRDVRREAREREGDPRLKQRRKQLHAEFVKMSQSLRNIRSADVLITNPEHIALGLRYDRRTMQAPTVVSVGTNQFAQRLKRLAFIYGIPVIENRSLARELLRYATVNKPIPDHCFRPVADIYKAVRRNVNT
jgi:flagellar biosynthetic protein FlhB